MPIYITKKYDRLLTLLVLCTVFFCGCGQSTSLKGLVKGSGTLTHNGQPVEGASIMFAPAPGSPAENRAASAKTDAQGKFTLMTLHPNDGVFPGKYRIMVSKSEASGGGIVPGTEGNDPKFKDDRVTIDYLPRKYKEPDTSGIEITIPAGGDKAIEIKLEGTADTSPQKIQRNTKR